MNTKLKNFMQALKNNNVAYVKISDRCGMGSYLDNSKEWTYRIYKKDLESPTKVLWTGDFISGYPKDVMLKIFKLLNISYK